MRDSFNAFSLLVRGHAACFTPFLHIHFGREYPGKWGIVALLLMLLTMGAKPDAGMLVFFLAWLTALAYQRARMFLRERRGVHEYSRYDGWPWLAIKDQAFEIVEHIEEHGRGLP